MPKFNIIKNNFLKGEYSPRSKGRTDIEEYFQGAAEMTNVFGHVSGGAFKRRGSIFVTDQREISTNGVPGSDSDIDSKLRIFAFPTTDGRRQFIQIKINDDANPWGNICISIENSIGDISTTVSPSSTSSDLFFNKSSASDFASEIDINPWGRITDDDRLRSLVLTRIGDILWFSGKEVPLFWIKSDDGVYTCGSYLTPPDGFITNIWESTPFRLNIVTDDTLANDVNPGVAGGAVTITETNNANRTIGSTDQRILRFNGGAVILTSVFSGGTASAIILDPFSASSATASWEYSSWGGVDGSGSYPTALGFHEQRLYTGGTTSEPNKIYASETGDITQFALALGGSIVATSPFGIALSSTDLETIKWFSSGTSLFVGTDKSEYRLFGPDPQEAFSALNVSAIRETQTGSSDLSISVRIDNSLYFVDASAVKIREYVFNENENAFRSNNVMRFADHMTKKSFTARLSDLTEIEFSLARFREVSQINEMYYSNTEDLLFLKDVYAGLTVVAVDRESALFCPTTLKLSGSLDDNDFPKIHSICILPRNPGYSPVGDQLYMVVERTINSSQKFTIEKIFLSQFAQEDLNPEFSSGLSSGPPDLPVYVDGAVLRVGSGTPTTTLSGLDHLEGEVLDILADGIFVGQKTVSSGSITLDTAATIIIAGLPMTATIQTLRLDAGSAFGAAGRDGTSQRAIKRIDEVMLRVSDTVHLNIGERLDNMQEINFRDPGANPGDPIALFTGDKLVKPRNTWNRDQKLFITSTKPYPMFLAALIFRGETND